MNGALKREVDGLLHLKHDFGLKNLLVQIPSTLHLFLNLFFTDIQLVGQCKVSCIICSPQVSEQTTALAD
jgi:hypothetical protein